MRTYLRYDEDDVGTPDAILDRDSGQVVVHLSREVPARVIAALQAALSSGTPVDEAVERWLGVA